MIATVPLHEKAYHAITKSPQNNQLSLRPTSMAALHHYLFLETFCTRVESKTHTTPAATIYVSYRGDLCKKLFNSILDDEDHKLRNLLPPKVTSDTYNFRNEKLFNIPKYRINRFRDTFIISSLINW